MPFNVALEQFYKENYATAQYVIKHILIPPGNMQDVEECTQDVLYEVMNNQHKYDATRGGIKNYIRVIARSKALYMKNKIMKKQTLPLQDDILISYEDEHQTKETIKEILSELNEKERQLFTLKFIYQMPSEEIGKILKKSRNSVDVSITRLRKKISNSLTEHQIEIKG